MRDHANQSRMRMAYAAFPILVALLIAAPSLWAADDATELAKKTQNPVADLISIPLQNNFNFGVGRRGGGGFGGERQQNMARDVCVGLGQ